MISWESILVIASACIVSAGGVSGIIIIIIKFSSNWIADALAKKYELKLNKELERYKAGVENKIYISKAKFDVEFQLYRQLSKVFVDMVKEVVQLFPVFTRDCRDDHEKYKAQYETALEKTVIAQDELHASAAFISAELYESFGEIEELCKLQIGDFIDFRLRPDATDFRNDCRDAFIEAYKRTREIDEKFDKLLVALRDYLSKIDVLE